MADVAEPWGSAESDGASVRDLFDPVSLEAKLVEARARRARILDARSAAKGPTRSGSSAPRFEARRSTLRLLLFLFGLAAGATSAIVALFPAKLLTAMPAVPVAPLGLTTLPIVLSAPAGVPDRPPHLLDSLSLIARVGVPMLVPPHPADVLPPPMASLVIAADALVSSPHPDLPSGRPIAVSRSRSITSPVPPFRVLRATGSLVRSQPLVPDTSEGGPIQALWLYRSAPEAPSAGSPSDFGPLSPPTVKPPAAPVSPSESSSGDPGTLFPGTQEPPTTPLPPSVDKLPDVPVSPPRSRPHVPSTPPSGASKPPTTRSPSIAQPTPTVSKPEPPSKLSDAARGQRGSKPEPAAGPSKGRGNSISRDMSRHGLSEPKRSGRSAEHGRGGLSGHSLIRVTV